MSDDSKSESGGGSGSTAHPVHDVIQAFGGIRPMANKLGIAVSTVQGWKNRDAIPDSRHADIREAARKHGISLSSDLLKASGDGSGEEGGVVEAEEVATGEPSAAGASAASGSASTAGTTAAGISAGATDTAGSAPSTGGSASAGTSSASSTPTSSGTSSASRTSAASGTPASSSSASGAAAGGSGTGGGSTGGGTGGGGGRGQGGGDEDVPPPPRVVERPRATGWVPGMLLGAAVLALGAGGAVVLRDSWLPLVRGDSVPDPVAQRFQDVEGQLSSLQGRVNGLSGEVESAAEAETLSNVRDSLDSLSEQVSQLEEQVAAGTAAAGENGGIAPKALTDLQERQDKLASRQDEMADQQAKLGKQQDELVSQQDELVSKQGEIAEQQTKMASRLDDMGGRFDDVTKRLDTVVERLDTLGKRLDTLGQETVKAADFQALSKRVDGLKKNVDKLAAVADLEKTRKEAAAAAEKAAAKELGRAMAVVQLQDALRDSQAYAGTLSAARKRLPESGPVTKALDTLAAHAESGVPTREALLAQFRKHAGQAVAVSAGDGEGDFMTGVLRRLGDVVRVRPVGQDQSGSGAGAVLARAEAKLKARNLEGAIADVKSLSGAPADSMAPWVEDARARLAVDSAVDSLRNAVIAPDGAANGNGDGA